MATVEVSEAKSVNAVALHVAAGVRYWEDATVNGIEDEDGSLIPCRIGGDWCPTIDIDTGIIRDWPANTIASIHYKVCDDGAYSLIGEDGRVIVNREGYVPSIMSPGGEGYGDYIIMTVGPDGQIANWNADLSDFEGDQ